MRVRSLVPLLALFVLGCRGKPTEDAPPVQAAAAPVSETPPAADDAKAPALTEEDERLIAADPKTLTPEERRKRAYALRRKIMQNPDSPTAQMLEDLRRATENGELKPPGTPGGLQFETRTAPVAKPAGTAEQNGATKAP
jgi:hypothetical protein